MQKSVKEDRQKWIGGSDIPVIMGISPFQTRYDLLLYKAGIKENEFEGNEYTEYGNIMEEKIRNYINNQYGVSGVHYEEGKHEYEDMGIRIHTDGEDTNEILEIKTTSQIHDDIDDYKIYLVQILFYMICEKKQYGMLAVYHRTDDFNEEFDKERLQIFNFSISQYEDLCNEIMEAVDQFMLDIEKLKENPLLSEEDLLPTPIVELSNQIVKLEEQLMGFKEIEKQQKELKTKLYEQMESYGIKNWRTPNGTLITKVAETPDKMEMQFNEDKFKEEQPIVYASYCEEKIKKGRAGGIRITLAKKSEENE